jgi:hypothetical protein
VLFLPDTFRCDRIGQLIIKSTYAVTLVKHYGSSFLFRAAFNSNIFAASTVDLEIRDLMFTASGPGSGHRA